MKKTELSFILAFNIVLVACNLDIIASETVRPAKIYSMEPLSAPKNSEVVIRGTGFNPTINEILVEINGKSISTSTSTDSIITLSIPPALGSGPLRVTVAGKEIATTLFFEYLWTVTTIGGDGASGFYDGPSHEARFNNPSGIAVDKDGKIFVADQSNNRIRLISPTGMVSTYSSSINSPYGVTTDNYNNVFVAGMHYVLVILPDGTETVVAGSQYSFYSSEFSRPRSVAIDISGKIFVADEDNHCIRVISQYGEVGTIAGMDAGFSDGTGNFARFNKPSGVAVSSLGTIYVADKNNHCIREISSQGVVSTLAGTQENGLSDGLRDNARFSSPIAIAVDGNENVYVADEKNHAIRRISSAGMVATIAGNKDRGFLDGVGVAARFDEPSGVAVDKEGVIYVADRRNHSIRKID